MSKSERTALQFLRGVVLSLAEWLSELGIDGSELDAIKRRIDYRLEER